MEESIVEGVIFFRGRVVARAINPPTINKDCGELSMASTMTSIAAALRATFSGWTEICHVHLACHPCDASTFRHLSRASSKGPSLDSLRHAVGPCDALRRHL